MRTVPALRTITLTDEEAEIVYEILAACIDQHHPSMTDDGLIRAIELRDRFRSGEDR